MAKDTPEEVKTFSDLEKEVQQRGLCGKCGGCVSFCTAGKLNALEVGEDGRPRYANPDNCLKCGICYLICPQIGVLDDELRWRFGWRAPIGSYRTINSARTTDEEIRKVCTDGGVVTSLLVYLLEHHLINGALVSKRVTPLTREPVIATTREELLAAAGSQFAESFHLEELGEKYTTYSPTISAVKGLEKRHLVNVALVGTPCQIHTIRKMQILRVLPAHVIRYTIGLFCMENFSFDDLHRRWLEQKLMLNMEDIAKLYIKDDVVVSLRSGVALHVPFEEVDEVARPACLVCSDFANEYADISVGGLGSPDGYTTTLVRTDVGDRIYAEAIRLGYIEEIPFTTTEALRVEKTKMVAKIVSFTQRKQGRAQENLEKIRGAGGGENV